MYSLLFRGSYHQRDLYMVSHSPMTRTKRISQTPLLTSNEVDQSLSVRLRPPIISPNPENGSDTRHAGTDLVSYADIIGLGAFIR